MSLRMKHSRHAALVILLAFASLAGAQQPINTAPSRQTLEEASRDSCEGVSQVVQRCSNRSPDTDKKSTDPLTRSRAATKAAFDRRDKRSSDAALQTPSTNGSAPAKDAPIGAGQRLDTVNVTGTADAPASIEEVLQRALNPAAGGVPGPNGTTSTYAPDGVRYDCISKCVGPACCATVRTLPNPARDANGINGH